MVLLTGAGSLAFWALPCSGQSTPPTSAAAVVGDSIYNAHMNEGYAAVAAGNHAQAVTSFDLAAPRAPNVPTPRIAAGYALMALKRNDEAISRFEDAIRIDENQDTIRRQLGYLYSSGGRNRDALTAFQWLQKQDRASAQDLLAIGNLSAGLDEPVVALKAFQDAETLAMQIGDSVVMRDARKSIRVLHSINASNAPSVFVDVYLSPFYQTRFENAVTFGFGRVGLTTGGTWKPAIYASLRATRDTKSVGGLQPILYSDNSVVPALGVRVRPGGKWFTLFAEAGVAYPLVDVTPREWKRDLRTGVIGAFSKTNALGSGPRHMSLVTDLFGDATYYDRFDKNIISYAQWRESLRLVQGRAGAIDIFTRGWGTFDSKNTYFNRAVEGGGGIAFHAGENRRATLYIDALAGRYLNKPINTQPSRTYSDFRIMLVTGLFRSLPLVRE